MKTRIPLLLIFGILIFSVNSFAQLLPAQPRPLIKENNTSASTDNLVVFPITPAQLAQELMGQAAAISNLSYTGSLDAIGKYIFTNSSIGLDSGVIMSSGLPALAIGPNTSTSMGHSFMEPGDSLLTALANQQTFDASVIEFDIAVTTDTLACQFIFGSEEYPEFVIGLMNDNFGFFLTGVDPFTFQYNVNKNIALVPGTNVPISIGTINNVLPSYPQYYVDNTGGTELQYDGYTVPMTLYCPVINGDTYHLKIAIADGGDAIYDSGIFLKGKWFSGYACMPVANFTPSTNGLTTTFDNSTTWAKYFVWDFGDGNTDTTLFGETCIHTYDSTGIYPVMMRAVNYYQEDTILQSVIVGNVGIVEYDNTIEIQRVAEGMYELGIPFAKNCVVTLFSIDGKEVYRNTGNGEPVISVDLRALPKGVYLVKVNTGNNTYSSKLTR